MWRSGIAALLTAMFAGSACGGTSSSEATGNGGPLGTAQCSKYVECMAAGASCAVGDCFLLDGCATAICIDRLEACRIRCGARECQILESYPAQIRCAGASGDAGGARTCEDVRAEFDRELAAVRACSSDSECGTAIPETSCGCTRDLVARRGANLDRLQELMRQSVAGDACVGFGGTCDCPAADGFVCQEGRCAWNYVPR